MRKDKRILVVDDERSIRYAIKVLLDKCGYPCDTAENGTEAKKLIEKNTYNLIISDIFMEKKDMGFEVMKLARQRQPGCPVILITAYGSVANAVRAMKDGAYDFIEKPFELSELEAQIKTVMQRDPVEKIPKRTRFLKSGKNPFEGIIGEHESVLYIFELIRRIADSKSNILITGETGTGKELFAQAIHKASTRSSKYFVPVHCGAIPPDLLEPELFGYKKGAFTGATSNRKGMFKLADQGTLLLDEIGDMPLNLQVKILRFLQEGEIKVLGATRPEYLDVRIVSATNVKLDELVAKNRFRKDLFYRLSVIEIEIPPLRKRKEDIMILAEHFVEKHNKRQNRKIQGISKETERYFLSYGWPGNVRELENAVERIVTIKGSGIIEVDDLPQKMLDNSTNDFFSSSQDDNYRIDLEPFSNREPDKLPVPQISRSPKRSHSFPQHQQVQETIRTSKPLHPNPQSEENHLHGRNGGNNGILIELPEDGLSLKKSVELYEYHLIDQALLRTENNRNKAAKLLQMNRTTLVEKLNRRNRKLKLQQSVN